MISQRHLVKKSWNTQLAKISKKMGSSSKCILHENMKTCHAISCSKQTTFPPKKIPLREMYRTRKTKENPGKIPPAFSRCESCNSIIINKRTSPTAKAALRKILSLFRIFFSVRTLFVMCVFCWSFDSIFHLFVWKISASYSTNLIKVAVDFGNWILHLETSHFLVFLIWKISTMIFQKKKFMICLNLIRFICDYFIEKIG